MEKATDAQGTPRKRGARAKNGGKDGADGANVYVAKPVDMEQLLAVLRLWLHR